MGKRKGFENPKPDLSQPIEIERVNAIATTVDRLKQLLVEIKKYNLSPRCYTTINKLAHMSPAVRLVVNIKVILAHLITNDINNVMIDGITRVEREVLTEIDSSLISLESRRTAHSLMNIDTRENIITLLKDIFKTMRSRKNHMLQ